MSRPRTRTIGFTLVEVMITLAIMGILAALAMPAFSSYANRAKTGEAVSNLNIMFKGAAAYYSGELVGKGMGSTMLGSCTIGEPAPSPPTPSGEKQPFTADPEFRAIRFTISDYVYFSYGLTSADPAGGACGHKANTTLYTFFANGDLDNDRKLSTFELAAGSDGSNVLYHSRGFSVSNETE